MFKPTFFYAGVLAAVAFTTIGCQTTAPNRFNQADTNHDGKLGHQEINTYLVSGIFESRDTNHDGKMTKAEWLVGKDAGQEKIFRDRDTNRDGVVTREEAIAYGLKKGTSAQLLRDADKNKDGYVSRAEVTAYYASKEGPVR